MDNKVSLFLDWWQRGLISALPFAAARKRVLKLSPDGVGVIADAVSAPVMLSDADLKKLAQRATYNQCYLLANDSKVMRTPIPVSMKRDSLASIAEALLPFNSGELVFAADTERSQMIAIARSETADDIAALEALGLSVSGFAFSAGESFYYSAAVDNIRSVKAHQTKLIAVMACALLLAFSGAGLLAWQAQKKSHADLVGQLASLRTTDELRDSSEVLKQLQGMSVRGTEPIIDVLEALIAELPVNAEVDQLILTESEVLLDARAGSATKVRSALEASKVFSDSEFVTAISSNAADQSERFRLKLPLAEAQVELSE